MTFKSFLNKCGHISVRFSKDLRLNRSELIPHHFVNNTLHTTSGLVEFYLCVLLNI